jgi:hypothetical protein
VSTYNWERGTILLPASEVAGVKETIRAAYNGYASAEITKADRCKADLGRWWDANKTTSLRKFKQNAEAYGDAILRSRSRPDNADCIQDAFWEAIRGAEASGTKITKRSLLKRAGRFAPKLATRSTKHFDVEGCGVRIEGRRITWDVDENNHAVEHCAESALGKAFKRAMRRVNWTHGTGGTIVGNDEYNQDSDFEGGGSNYVTQRFGPRGDPNFREPPRRPVHPADITQAERTRILDSGQAVVTDTRAPRRAVRPAPASRPAPRRSAAQIPQGQGVAGREALGLIRGGNDCLTDGALGKVLKDTTVGAGLSAHDRRMLAARTLRGLVKDSLISKIANCTPPGKTRPVRVAYGRRR